MYGGTFAWSHSVSVNCGFAEHFVYYGAQNDYTHNFIICRARKKPINHKHFGRNGVRDKQEPFLGQTGPLPGTNWDPSLGQTGLFLFNSTVNVLFCPVCPWDGWGFVPGTIVPQGPSEKCLSVSCLLVFFAPKFGNYFPNCTGYLLHRAFWQEFFCVIRAPR